MPSKAVRMSVLRPRRLLICGGVGETHPHPNPPLEGEGFKAGCHGYVYMLLCAGCRGRSPDLREQCVHARVVEAVGERRCELPFQPRLHRRILGAVGVPRSEEQTTELQSLM